MSRRALNVLELWPTMGYLHEFIGCQTKQSLVYDLQEPFRWIADVTVVEAFEGRVLDLSDFYFTGDDYRYRFEPEAKQRFLDLLRERFNSTVRYGGRALKWDTIVEQKTVELSRYLVSRTGGLDFSEPSLELNVTDDLGLRRRILSLSNPEAKKLGIGKSSLHYLRRRANTQATLVVHSKTRNRLSADLP